LGLRNVLAVTGAVALIIAVLPFALFVMLPLTLAFHVKYYRLRPPNRRCEGCPFEFICALDFEEL